MAITPCFQDSVTRLLPVVLPLVVFYTLLQVESRRARDRLDLADLSFLPRLHAQRLPYNCTSAFAKLAIERNNDYKSSATSARQTVPDHKTVNADRPLPPCAREGKRARTFLVVFMGHSGSSAIMSELRGHSHIHMEDAEPVDHYEYEFNTTLALARTRDFFTRGMKHGKVPGFKIRPWHIRQRPEAWAALVKEFSTRIVWQYRSNIVKQAVGEYAYKHFNDTLVLEGLRSKQAIKNRCSKGAGCSFKIENFDLFHTTLKRCLHSDVAITRAVHLILDGSKCVHALPYEEYLYNREAAMRRLQQFLGIPYETTAPERFKATRDNLCEVVTNWKELCDNFYGCLVWRHMFDDDRNGCTCDFSSGHTNYCDTRFGG